MSLIFNGIDLTQYLRIKDIRKDVLPPVNNTLRVIPGRHGAIVTNSRLDVGQIEIDVRLKAASKEERNAIIRILAGWLYTPEPKQLILPDEEGLYYMAKLDGRTEIDRILTHGDTTLFFILPDPVAYGAGQSALFVNDIAELTVQGTAETKPRFRVTFTAAADEWKVVNQDGYFIRIEHDFQEGDTLEVNCITGGIYVNDARKMDALDWQHSIFFPLRVGANTLEIMPKNICNTQVFWIPRYY